ncbi:MAG: ABC transporter permease [Treponema sp.]|jgi:putative spermidine/putrescine transport system permease protein|nr:ABC transporter permease [Treponema sp.]
MSRSSGLRNRASLWLGLPVTLLLALLFAAPMLRIFIRSLGEDGLRYYHKFIGDPFYRAILRTTVVVSLEATGISLLLGYPVAFFLARTGSKLRNILMIVVLFPFLVSAVVRSYGWMVILGKRGLLNSLLQGFGLIGEPLTLLNTPVAVIIGLVHLLVPYMILAITGVLQGIDPNVEYAAQSLGASPVATFFRVTLPLSSPGVISGCILVFILSMTSYVTPRLLGGARFRTMSTMVFQEINVNFNPGFAAAISYILLFAILAILILSNYATANVTNRVGGAKDG